VMYSPNDPGDVRTRSCPGCNATIDATGWLCGECLAREAERDDDGDDRNDSRPESTHSQPADFVGGESTGVQDL
jgi:hypothetical protein